ncbi:MAG: hypothetical protein JXI43_06330 [Tissierellales bacterium]|nr:hypothetical protein [Tissierellales bacterium]
MQKDLYILTIWRGVEPILSGPHTDSEARQDALSALKKENGDESGYFTIDAPEGAQIEIGQF